MAASVAFVVLYIWSTYEPAARGSWRHMADLALSALFAADLAIRLKVGMGSCRGKELRSMHGLVMGGWDACGRMGGCALRGGPGDQAQGGNGEL